MLDRPRLPWAHSAAQASPVPVAGQQPDGALVEAAVYVDGRRLELPRTLPAALRTLRTTAGAMAWLGFYHPAERELLSLAEEFPLHPLAVEDAVSAHQRPKLEHYGDTLFVVLRAARYVDEAEEVEVSELH